YLLAPVQGLWRWAEDGSVIVWQDGSTIAFREEIRPILEWLAPNGLPPFGAVVLMLAACRGKTPVATQLLDDPAPAAGSSASSRTVILRAVHQQAMAQSNAALEELRKLSS